MKKVVSILSALMMLLALNVNAQGTQETRAKEAHIEFESDVVDYGTIDKGSDPKRTIKFKNTGTAPLVITNCKGSCGCTVPTCPKDPIMPGETGKLEVRYDTNRVGAINKTVTVKSNAANGTTYIKVKGKVENNEPADEFPSN